MKTFDELPAAEKTLLLQYLAFISLLAANAAITLALQRINTVLQHLGVGYAGALRRSMKSYKDSISKAYRNVVEYFLFPLPIEGISD